VSVLEGARVCITYRIGWYVVIECPVFLDLKGICFASFGVLHFRNWNGPLVLLLFLKINLFNNGDSESSNVTVIVSSQSLISLLLVLSISLFVLVFLFGGW